MNRPVTNCFLLGSTRPADSDGATTAASWFHTIPAIGEYPNMQIMHQGKPVIGTIIVDQKAVESCIAAFNGSASKPEWRGLLVDREHFSLMSDKPSDAMAWVKQIRSDDKGIWTQWAFTPPGQKLWDDKVLISRSPVMDLQALGKDRFRPVAIISIAMTNTPQFETLSTSAAARAAETQNKQGDTTMIKLLALLGLAETATEDEAIAAVQVLIDAAKAAEAEVETAQAEVVARRCVAFIAANKGSISDVDKFKMNYLAAPDATEAAFGTFRAAPGKGTRIIARDASNPGDTLATKKPDAQIAAKRNASVSTYRAGNPTASFNVAWSACRTADPDLFADPDQQD